MSGSSQGQNINAQLNTLIAHKDMIRARDQSPYNSLRSFAEGAKWRVMLAFEHVSLSSQPPGVRTGYCAYLFVLVLFADVQHVIHQPILDGRVRIHEKVSLCVLLDLLVALTRMFDQDIVEPIP